MADRKFSTQVAIEELTEERDKIQAKLDVYEKIIMSDKIPVESKDNKIYEKWAIQKKRLEIINDRLSELEAMALGDSYHNTKRDDKIDEVNRSLSTTQDALGEMPDTKDRTIQKKRNELNKKIKILQLKKGIIEGIQRTFTSNKLEYEVMKYYLLSRVAGKTEGRDHIIDKYDYLARAWSERANSAKPLKATAYRLRSRFYGSVERYHVLRKISLGRKQRFVEGFNRITGHLKELLIEKVRATREKFSRS